MAKLEKDKIALFLACASVLSGQTSAMNVNKAQNPQTVAAPQVRKGMPVGAKVLLGIIGGASVIELIHSGFGFFTNSILGKYSLGELAKKALDNKKAPGGKKEGNVGELPVDNNVLVQKMANILSSFPDFSSVSDKKNINWDDPLLDEALKYFELCGENDLFAGAMSKEIKQSKKYILFGLNNYSKAFEKLTNKENEIVRVELFGEPTEWKVQYCANEITFRNNKEVATFTLKGDKLAFKIEVETDKGKVIYAGTLTKPAKPLGKLMSYQAKPVPIRLK